MRKLFMLLSAAVVAAVVWAPVSASAHASLKSTTPAQGAELETMPEQVSLTLTEPVQKPSFVEVTSSDGTRVNSETVTVRDDTVTSAIDQAAPAGSYRVTYRIVSADDHTVAGAIDFEVRSSSPDPTPSPTTPQPTEPAPSPTPSPTSAARSQTQVLPSSGGSTTAKDALTIVGFSVVTMTGLVLLLRAGLKSAGSEDED